MERKYIISSKNNKIISILKMHLEITGLNHPEWKVVIWGDAYSSWWYNVVMPNQMGDVKPSFQIPIATMCEIWLF